MSIGGLDYPMAWHWFFKNKAVGNIIGVKLNDGDVYIMSEKAVGTDWKKSSIYTLRHSAGESYIKTIEKKK